MLSEPPPTAWDLRWQMFGIPIRVHPLFWLVTLLLGQNALRDGPAYLLAWVGCVFVSVLVHEIGHIIAGRLFGSYGHIVLYSFGGLAIGSNRLSNSWQRIAVSFAGPAAGFLFLALIVGLLWVRYPGDQVIPLTFVGVPIPLPAGIRFNPLAVAVVFDLIFINLFWGIINLLPVYPLDGGQISRELCGMASPGHGLKMSLMISTIVAGGIAGCSVLEYLGRPVLPFSLGSWYTALMFGLLAYQSYQGYLQAQSERRWMDDHWHRYD